MLPNLRFIAGSVVATVAMMMFGFGLFAAFRLANQSSVVLARTGDVPPPQVFAQGPEEEPSPAAPPNAADAPAPAAEVAPTADAASARVPDAAPGPPQTPRPRRCRIFRRPLWTSGPRRRRPMPRPMQSRRRPLRLPRRPIPPRRRQRRSLPKQGRQRSRASPPLRRVPLPLPLRPAPNRRPWRQRVRSSRTSGSKRLRGCRPLHLKPSPSERSPSRHANRCAG
jgi:hypothetical protein